MATRRRINTGIPVKTTLECESRAAARHDVDECPQSRPIRSEMTEPSRKARIIAVMTPRNEVANPIV